MYLINITLHGLIMIFFLIMPSLLGSYGNYLLPIYLGGSEIIYPRINNISILIIPSTLLIMILSIVSEYTLGLGWTLYPPLSSGIDMLTSIGIDFILYSLILSGISTSLTSINFIVSIHTWKILLIPISNVNMYLWSIIVIGYILLIVIPILGGILLLLLCDIHYNTIFFDPLYGGDPIFYQHMFWFFGHPEVYILILPGFGIISNII
jgi:heme/copper-type cytochrome/quinol oxidase subunit 1